MAVAAAYKGDDNLAPGAAALTQVVRVPTITSLSCLPNPSSFGKAVVIVARVGGAGVGVPTGPVTFASGEKVLATKHSTPGSRLDHHGHPPTGDRWAYCLHGGDSYFASSSAAVLHRVDTRHHHDHDVRPSQPAPAGEHLASHRST